MSGPSIHPSPLKLWAILIRLAAPCGGPKTVVYGLAAVSRQDKPQAIIKSAIRKGIKAASFAAG